MYEWAQYDIIVAHKTNATCLGFVSKLIRLNVIHHSLSHLTERMPRLTCMSRQLLIIHASNCEDHEEFRKFAPPEFTRRICCNLNEAEWI